MGMQYKCVKCGKQLKSIWNECPDCKNPVQSRIPMTIGTIGQIGHGKTTLTAAIANYCENKFGDGVWSDDESASGDVDVRYIEYRSAKRTYTHIEYREHGEYIRYMIKGKDRMDGAVLVVSARDSVMPQTVEHAALAKKTGTSSIIVFLNKIDLLDYPGQADLVEKEIREILNANGYPGDDIPVIRGSAVKALKDLRDKKETKNTACIEKIVNAIDSYFQDPSRILAESGIINIDDVFDIENQESISNGFKGIMYCLSRNEGGRQAPFKDGERVNFNIADTDVTGVINVLNANSKDAQIMPGEYAEIKCSMETPISVKKYLPFTVQEGKKTTAFGQILQV